MRAERATRLTAAVEDLAAAETEAAVHETTAEAATDLLSADVTAVATRDGGEIRPEWVVTDRLYARPLVDAENSVAGETLATGEAIVVDDLGERGVAGTPEGLRSVLSVPVGDDGVVQALAGERAAFSEADLEVARLLAVQTEQALRRVRSERDARRERGEFAALFDNVVDAALQYRVEDGRPVIERVNPAFVGNFGLEAETVVGHPLAELPIVGGGVGAAEWEGESGLAGDGVTPTAAETAVPERQGAVRGERLERRVTRRTETGPRRFLLQTVPVGDRDDDAVGYVIYTDIEEAASRLDQLRQQNERLEEFAQTVSHDLRNPLEVALGYLDAAVNDEAVGREAALDEVESALDRMDRIVDDVLTMARQGQAVVDTDPVSLETVARSAWDNVDTGDADLVVESDATLQADRSRLSQLLENLHRNAVEHGPGGSERDLTVTVGELERAGFYVEDDGSGIPPDRREAALEVGYTTADDGTGLGLALVERIAGAHGWSVDLDESETGGLRVVVLRTGDESDTTGAVPSEVGSHRTEGIDG